MSSPALSPPCISAGADIWVTFYTTLATPLYYKGEKLDPRGAVQDTDFHGYGVEIRERLDDLIPRDEEVMALDIGTGMGSTAKFLLQHISNTSRVWSLDPSEDVIAKARKEIRALDKHRKIKFVRGSADALRFKDNSFDIVVSVMVMHHMEAVDDSISEMSRVLKKGGRLLIVDYSPEAHTLEFHSRHAKEDFFTSSSISKAAKDADMIPRVENHDKWYLVEATKPNGNNNNDKI